MKKKLKVSIIINLIIGYVLSAFMTGTLLLEGFFADEVFYEITKGMLSQELGILIFFLLMGILFFLVLNIIYLPIFIVRLLLRSRDIINRKYTDTKETIYTRDLPEYNSAVAGELLDFKTSFEQEYVATVMELIAKGYIIENENMLTINDTKSTEKLLKNEKFILRNCQHIKNSNYSKYAIDKLGFYKELKEDMYDLGLYKKKKLFNETANKIAYYIKRSSKQQERGLIYLIFFMALILFSILVENLYIMLILYFIILVLFRKEKLTKVGELEKEKISKLMLFLEKEMDFKEKENNERRVWDRYSAFAVALGINTKMTEEIKNKILNKMEKTK